MFKKSKIDIEFKAAQKFRWSEYKAEKKLRPRLPHRHINFKKLLSRKWSLKELKEKSKQQIFNPNPYNIRRKKKHRPTGSCQVCGGKSTCQRHIILLKNGGSDKRKNRINICDTCHAQIHDWMDTPKPEYIAQMDMAYRNTIAYF